VKERLVSLFFFRMASEAKTEEVKGIKQNEFIVQGSTRRRNIHFFE